MKRIDIANSISIVIMYRNEYSRAAEYAEQLITYGSNNKTRFVACILNADVMFHMKKKGRCNCYDATCKRAVSKK